MTDVYLQGARQRFIEFGGFEEYGPDPLPNLVETWAEGILVREEPGLITLVALLPQPPEGVLLPLRDQFFALADQVARSHRTQVFGVILLIVEDRLTRDQYSRWQELIRCRGRARVVPWVVDLTRQELFEHDGPPFGVDPDLVTLAEPEPPGYMPRLRRNTAPAPNPYPFPWATVSMIAVLVVIWVAMTVTGRSLSATEDIEVLTRWGGLSRPDLWRTGEYWRMLTATFLHIGAAHLVMNSLGLWAVGRLVEWWFGVGRMLVIYLLAGVAGFALSAVAGPPAALSAGASGAIMGLLGALVWFRYASPLRDRLPGKPFFLVLAATLVSDGVLFYMMDNWAHFGGFAGGLIAAAVVGLPLVPGVERPKFRFHWMAHVVAALVLVALAGATLAGRFDLPGPGRDLARSLDALEAGRLPEAEAGLRRAVARQDDEPWLRLLLSQTLLEEGNCGGARAEWQEARELGAEESDLQDLDRAIRHCGM